MTDVDMLVPLNPASPPAPAVEEAPPVSPAKPAARARPRKVASSPAMISRGALNLSVGSWSDRIVGLSILTVSFLGAVTAFYGWNKPAVSLQFGAAMLGGFGIQGFITLYQWQHSPIYGLRQLSAWRRVWRVLRQLTPRYLASVAVGVGLSLAGYVDLVMPRLLALAERFAWLVRQPATAAWTAFILAALVVEMAAEFILVDD